jgi:hypothetical protein
MARKPKQGVLPGMARFAAVPPSQPTEPTEAEKLQDLAARAPMRIMADMPGVQGIVASGQFKTQHETGTSNPQASFNPERRAAHEDVAFGPGQRPVYGYFSHGDERDVMRSGAGSTDPNARYDEVSGYGHTAFELGEHMRKHTTYAWGDTLGGSPDEITKQGEQSVPLQRQGVDANPLADPRFSHADSFYTEMHVHKRPNINDISQAIIYEQEGPDYIPGFAQGQTERTAKTQAVLMGGNIPHEVRRVGEGGQMVLPLEHEDWGHAHWKRAEPGQAGRTISQGEASPAASWLHPEEESATFRYETPADEQRPMVSVRDKWRPPRARP